MVWFLAGGSGAPPLENFWIRGLQVVHSNAFWVILPQYPYPHPQHRKKKILFTFTLISRMRFEKSLESYLSLKILSPGKVGYGWVWFTLWWVSIIRCTRWCVGSSIYTRVNLTEHSQDVLNTRENRDRLVSC